MEQSAGGHSTLSPVKLSSGPPSLSSPKGATIQLEMLEITSSLGAVLRHLPQLPYHSFTRCKCCFSPPPPLSQGLVATGIGSSLQSLTVTWGWEEEANALPDPFLHHGSKHLSRH